MWDFRGVIAVAVLLAVQACYAPSGTTDDPDTVARLQMIVIPEVDFRETAVSEVLEFFHFSSLPIGYKPPPMRQEVNQNEVIYFLPVPDFRDPRVVPPGTQQEAERAKFRVCGPLITLSANDISFMELFQRVANAAKGTMVVRPDMVIIRTPLPSSGGLARGRSSAQSQSPVTAHPVDDKVNE